MNISRIVLYLGAATMLAAAAGGCCRDKCAYGLAPPSPLGTISDPVWQRQEENAEASDFVIHEHEFIGNTVRLNKAGEEHVKQIAARADETSFPIIIERSSMSMRKDDPGSYPVHNDEVLDGRRRQLVVQALTTLGVPEAEQRVVVGPAPAPGFKAFEAERAFIHGFGGREEGFGAFGGFGGFGGF